jgi:hypothetical protein
VVVDLVTQLGTFAVESQRPGEVHVKDSEVARDLVVECLG